MFLRYFVEVPLPAARVETLLEATLKRFLDEVASRLLAGRNGQAASTEAQGSNGGASPDW